MKLVTLRDGQNRIVGTTTTNSNGDAVARDRRARSWDGRAKPSTTPVAQTTCSSATTQPMPASCCPSNTLRALSPKGQVHGSVSPQTEVEQIVRFAAQVHAKQTSFRPAKLRLLRRIPDCNKTNQRSKLRATSMSLGASHWNLCLKRESIAFVLDCLL
jgi:hypothetical protein